MDIPRLSGKEVTILELLRHKRECFGLEMVKLSDGALKRGTIYVTLSRMEDKGYITSWQEKAPKDPGLPRRLYRMTGEGARALAIADAAKAAALGEVGYA